MSTTERGRGRPESRNRAGRAPVRVVVVADSAPRRRELIETLEADGDIAVAGQAVDAVEAVRSIDRLHPDVVTMDLPAAARRPAVEQIMGRVPTPILVCCGDPADPAPSLPNDLLMAGALGAMARPAHWTPATGGDVRRQVRLLRGVTVVRHPRGRMAAIPPVGPVSATAMTPPSAPPSAAPGSRPLGVVAIAASTGGPAALATVLSGLAGIDAPVLVVQHIHPDFVEGLVLWMARVAPVPVRLAVDGDRLDRGVVYIGPGNLHLKVGPGLRIVLDLEPASTHRPSANELFSSVANQLGAGAVGVVLTGMGDDGTDGLLDIHQRGGLTIAQDEATSAVFGMPRAAEMAGAVSRVLPLGEIAPAIVAASVGRRA